MDKKNMLNSPMIPDNLDCFVYTIDNLEEKEPLVLSNSLGLFGL